MKKLKTAGMWEKNGFFYTRRRVGTRVTWVPLGNDFTAARKRKAEITTGAPVLKKVTVSAALADWLSLYVATRRTQKNQKLTAQRVRDYIKPFFGGIVLDKVTSDHIRSYRVYLDKKGLAKNTVMHFMSDVRCFLKWAEETQRIDRSPFPRRVMPRVQETLPKGLSDAEVATLCTLPEPLGFEFRLLLGTGLRWAEACRAQASHIREGAIHIAKTKSGKARRIPLSAEFLAECSTRVGRLFDRSEGSTGSFNRMVRRVTGIADFHVHRTRHTYAMRWVAQGGSLSVLQELLGHADLSTTARYARVTQGLVEREVKRVNERA